MAWSLGLLRELRLGSPQSETPTGVKLVVAQSHMLMTLAKRSYNGAAEPRQPAKEFTLNVLIEHYGNEVPYNS